MSPSLFLVLVRLQDWNLFINSKLRIRIGGTRNIHPFWGGDTSGFLAFPFLSCFFLFFHSVLAFWPWCECRFAAQSTSTFWPLKTPRNRVNPGRFWIAAHAEGFVLRFRTAQRLFSMRTFWIIRNIFVLDPKTRHIHFALFFSAANNVTRYGVLRYTRQCGWWENTFWFYQNTRIVPNK